MKKIIWIGVLGGLFLTGCSQKDAATPAPAPNENVVLLQQQFQGKYEIVSSTSSEPVDVNLDGKSSVDLFQEYPYLSQHTLRIDIYGPNTYNPKRSFIFYQFWPEQYVRLPSGQEWTGQTIPYEPGSSADFAMQGATLAFNVSPDVKQLLVEPGENISPFRWQRPESVTVEGTDSIRTVNKRLLYTQAGVKTVTITTLYKRFTKTT